jgi:ABC-type sugar transport system ATPase subunit
MLDIHKSFGGVLALQGARLVLEECGSVHALMGANGSGKSTMLNILSGQLRPDEGTIIFGGRPVEFGSPAAAVDNGIAMVSQESALAADLSIAENVLLGRRLVRGPLGLDWRATRERARVFLDQLGVDYDPSLIVRTLKPDQRQMVEIARALSTNAKILILDEPTSSLTEEETAHLFAVIRRLREQRVCVIYVSHRLAEVYAVADRATVLRDGVTVAEVELSDFTRADLVHAMVGETRPCAPRTVNSVGARTKLVLQARELRVPGYLHDIGLDLHEGEIVGLAGLVGSGRSELLETLYGLRVPASGSLSLLGRSVLFRKPRDAMNSSIGFVPPDRKTQGIILLGTVRDNLTLAATSKRWWLGNRRSARVTKEAAGVSALLRIKAALDDVAQTLSGGNQQKVVLGKWLVNAPRVLLLDEPTRGVDVMAKAEIHCYLRDLASEGVAMLVSSSEYDELCEVCDRILVLVRGRIVADLPREEATETKLAVLAGGAE